ncbi:TPA: hypothetical protein ACQTZL_003732 [Pseudomonas aeruginosa]
MNRSHVIEALRAADWSNAPIGNKALIQAAIEHLEAQPSSAFRPAQVISYRPGMGEVTVYTAGGVPGYMNIGDTVYVSDRAPVEHAGGDERAGLRAAAKWHRGQRNAFEAEAEMHRQRYENTNRPDSLTAEAEHHRRLWETASAMAANHLDYAAGFEEMARADLAQPSPAPELAERGTQHRFSTTEQTCRHDFAGVWWNDNGETKTGRECRHCGFFVADVVEAQPEQTGQPEVVATLEPYSYDDPEGVCYIELRKNLTNRDAIEGDDRLMMVSQYETIVGALRTKADQLREALEWRKENQVGQRELLRSVTAERDAAQARVAELEAKLGPALGLLRESRGFVDCDNPLNESGQIKLLEEIDAFLTSPVAQAQHSVPDGWKLVPMDPTSQMTFVGQSLRYDAVNSIGEIYRQMLAAAPASSEES